MKHEKLTELERYLNFPEVRILFDAHQSCIIHYLEKS